MMFLLIDEFHKCSECPVIIVLRSVTVDSFTLHLDSVLDSLLLDFSLMLD